MPNCETTKVLATRPFNRARRQARGPTKSAHCWRDNVSIIVGQSGVGKSTLINLLIGDERQRTASISDKRGEGRHTTVNSVMLTLPGGGSVIDSPGVRDYAPALRPRTRSCTVTAKLLPQPAIADSAIASICASRTVP